MIITKAEAKARGMTEDKTCDFHNLHPDQSALKFCQDCIIIRDPCGCDMDMSCEECDPKNEIRDIQNRCTFSVISNIEDESGNYIARCTLAYHFTPCKGDRTKIRGCPLWGVI